MMKIRETIKDFFALTSATGLGGATRRAARTLLATLLLTMTAQTAWATVRTVTYTLTDHENYGTKYRATFTATGDINATYTVDLPGQGANALTASWTLGDFRFNWASSSDDQCYFRISDENAIHGFKHYPNWTFTISNDNYYIDNVKYYNQRGELRADQDNNTKSLALTTSNNSMGGIYTTGIQAFTVTYSDSPAYPITYELNGGKNAAANPERYEQGTGVVSLAAPTYKAGYDFGGWYDNDGFSGSPVTSIAANSTGAVTLYAKWTPHTYTITYERNGGKISGLYITSYTVETSTFNLPSATRDGYYFRGWYDNAEFASAAVTQIKQGSTGDKTFYAKWEQWDENGDGTQWNPYKIRNEADLRALATAVNGGSDIGGKYYQQTADITITGGDWTPIGTDNNYFNGNYDGGGYTISGISIDRTENFTGLFGKVIGTKDQHRGFIQNIVLANSTIKGASYTGGIVGRMGNGHVLNCHVRNSVTVQANVDGTSSTNKKLGFGGVVGYMSGGTVRNCTSMATVDNGGHQYVQYFGGVIGYMTNSTGSSGMTATAADCFSYNKAPIGRQASKPYSGTATNVERVHKVQNTDGNVTLPEDVPTTAGFLYDGMRYYKGGAVVPLVVNLTEEAGYTITVSYKPGSDAEVTISPDDFGDYYFTVPAQNKTFTVKAAKAIDPDDFSQDGDTYTIHTATGWNVFCDLLAENDKGYFSGKTVLLGDDITVTRMAGGSNHDFTGTFDGQGNTLTLNYTTTEEKAAPFRNVESGCVIQNLHVAGTIQTSAKYAAGLVGTQYGAVTIRNCRSSVTINSTVSGDGTHGGLVALNGNGNGSNLTIEGCVFDGSLLGASTNSCSGFVGYKSNGRTVSITNSLFAPTEVTISETSSATFARNWTMPADANSYYTAALGTAQGTAAYVYTPASDGFVPANVGAEGTAYSVSSITAYANGLERDGKFYLVKAAVSLADNADNSGSIVNNQVADVTLAGRTLYKDGSWNTLCLPFEVDLTATDCPLYGATARTVTAASVSGTTLNLTFGDAVNTLEAGTPYIIKWDGDGTSNIENPVFEGVTIEATKNDYDTNAESVTTDERVRFVGTYKSTPFDAENKSILLMGGENTLYYPAAGAGIGAQRAYFKIGGDDSALLARRLTAFSIDFGEDEEEATGIISVSAETRNNADGWYSLDGRKLVGKPTQNGIYINNGKKVVIK